MSLEQILRFARRMKNADIPRTIRRDIFEASESTSNRDTYLGASIALFTEWGAPHQKNRFELESNV